MQSVIIYLVVVRATDINPVVTIREQFVFYYGTVCGVIELYPVVAGILHSKSTDINIVSNDIDTVSNSSAIDNGVPVVPYEI